MRYILCVDGGPQIGFGHAARMGTLATTLLERGHEVTVLSQTRSYVRGLIPTGANVVEAPDGYPAALRRFEAAATVIDLPSDSESTEVTLDTVSLHRSLSQVTESVVVFRDDIDGAVCCDLLVNGHLYADEAQYDLVGTEPEWCLGTDYLLLDEDVRTLANRELSTARSRERALVTMGGADVRNDTPEVMRAFDGVNIDVEVIVGPGFSNRDAIRQAASETDCSFMLTEDPDNFAERLYRADFAVSALGLTSYNLLALGTPFIGFPVAPDQGLKADALADRNAALVLSDSFSTTELEAAIDQFVGTPDFRRTLAMRGRDLVDANGIDRICDAITSTAAR